MLAAPHKNRQSAEGLGKGVLVAGIRVTQPISGRAALRGFLDLLREFVTTLSSWLQRRLDTAFALAAHLNKALGNALLSVGRIS
jgi:hypothetical protein